MRLMSHEQFKSRFPSSNQRSSCAFAVFFETFVIVPPYRHSSLFSSEAPRILPCDVLPQ